MIRNPQSCLWHPLMLPVCFSCQRPCDTENLGRTHGESNGNYKNYLMMFSGIATMILNVINSREGPDYAGSSFTLGIT